MHLFPHSTVHSICTDNNVPFVSTTILCDDTNAIVGLLETNESLLQQNLVFAPDVLVQLAEEHLALHEDHRIPVSRLADKRTLSS